MNTIENIYLTSQQSEALNHLKQLLLNQFEIENIVLYGSVARGKANEESDIDILIITAKPFNRFERHKITDATFEINLHYNTNISTMVVDCHSWEDGGVSILPIHDSILREGIQL